MGPVASLRRPLRVCTLLLVALAPLANAETLAQRIDAQLAQPRFAAASWGVAVISLDDGHTVYAHDAGRLLLPASTAKLYTAAYALAVLGPAYRTHTDALAAGTIEHGRLHGPMVLRGRGDPTLSGNAWADDLAAQIKAHGIQRIDGGIVGDDTVFTGAPAGSGWEVSDLQAAYGATAGPLVVDENTMVAALAPGKVSVAPDDAAITLAEQDAGNTELYRSPGSSTLHVLRKPNDIAPAQVKLSLPDPALTAARRLQSALERIGIRVDAEARSVHWPVPPPAATTVLASVASPPLGDILRSGLKRSQNLYLQSVFLLTGLESTSTTAVQAAAHTEARAAAGLAAWLGTQGIGPSSTMMEEGTGLSRHDLTTASSLVHLLALMDASPQADLWRDLLPVAGVDGTLARRMRGTAAEGTVQAKTGSMSFVNAMAGYATTKSGQRLAFAILLNNYRPISHSAEPAASASTEVDAIATMLSEAKTHL